MILTRTFVLVSILLLSSGCSTRIIQVPFTVESIPPGAQVDVDGVNFGNAPVIVNYNVTQLWNGLLNSPNWVPANQQSTITAYPPSGAASGTAPQSKTIKPGVTNSGAGGKVLFDFRSDQLQPRQTLDVNVKNRK